MQSTTSSHLTATAVTSLASIGSFWQSSFASIVQNSHSLVPHFLVLVTSFIFFKAVDSKMKLLPCFCKDDKEGLPRRLSFTSASMAMGPWPVETSMCEPIINATLFFDTVPSPEALRGLVEFALTFERMSGVPVGTEGKNDWTMRKIHNIDEERLVRVVKTSCDDDELIRVIANHMQESLREGRGELPWWEFLIIDNSGSGKSAVVLRIEHALGDGLSLVKLFEGFLTKEDGSPVENLVPTSMNAKFEKQKKSKWGMYAKVIPSLGKVLGLPVSKYDDDTAFSKSANKNMIYNGNRKIVVFNTVPLTFIKDIKKASGVTVNDVLFCALSMAIHEYNKLLQCPVQMKRGKKLQCRALMPVAFPRPAKETGDHSQAMRNKWCFISANMGVGIEDCPEKLMHINKVMKNVKESPVAHCQLKVQETIPPKLPLKLARQTVYDTFSRHSLVFSNVPGPDYPVLFGRQPVLGCQMFFNNLIPQVGILSYNNNIHMNIIVDPEAIPQSEVLPRFYSQALVSLATSFDVSVPSEVHSCASE
mmetsp:Transcript_25745/g.39912  ORF Transcript_25745/g.39912 Transcript_25745/m.39912 type:complete len:533 (-) Transcript_25745:109-1707(-)